MVKGIKLYKYLWVLLILELVYCRTVTHYKTTFDENGKKTVKTWTTNDSDSDESKSEPDTETLPIGSTNTHIEDMIKQAASRGMNPDAVRQVLETKQPVVLKETDAKGQTCTTTTYKLEPDGSISWHTLTESIPIRTVHTYSTHSVTPYNPIDFDTTSTTRKPAQDWEWNPRANMPNMPKFTPTLTRTYPSSIPTTNIFDWPTKVDDEVFERRENPNQPRLPVSWNPDNWPKLNNPFLHNLPETTSKRTSLAESTTKKSTYSDSIIPTRKFISNSTPPTTKTIKVEDLPVMQIFKDGKPVDESFIRTLPSDLRPLPAVPTHTYKVDNIPKSDTFEPSNPIGTREDTSFKSFTQTVSTPNLLTAGDLDPRIRDILEKAGIDPTDISAINGNEITKTRTEPDGRVIKTTYRVRTEGVGNTPRRAFDVTTTTPKSFIPLPSNVDKTDPNKVYADFYDFPRPAARQPPSQPGYFASHNDPLSSYGGNFGIGNFGNPIEQFLAKVGITIGDIKAKNNEFVKTIVTDDGQILTATFLLSTVKGNNNDEHDAKSKMEKEKPLK